MKINNESYKTIWVDNNNKIKIIDQTKLPFEFVVCELKTLDETIKAITTMQVRGAPLIGATAAFGIALAMKNNSDNDALDHACQSLVQSRPTAVNLENSVKRMKSLLDKYEPSERYDVALQEANKICSEDVECCRKIGVFGKKIIEEHLNKIKGDSINILTHCNAGWLATIDWGTATSPIYHAFKDGIKIHVWVDETRPRNQGSQLTAYELTQEGIKNTVIADNTGGILMQRGQVDMCITGADRVLKNGDVINKIGTYLKALAAVDNQIPFYVAFPTTTFDKKNVNASNINIEERSPDELSIMRGISEDGTITELQIYANDTDALNIAFDITPGKYVTKFITELGIHNTDKDSIDELYNTLAH